ncbi:MAG TPA: 1,4-dihydroxy-6-naphthoate synthase [Ferruginibacter sp.]|jgi:1,4-dihydroxy-6-naphthoate synthase|nr:1,4-dihydroxy-6-naphthoate synthase [Ferruginibacter sp.]HPA23273.1 1,4-dihydroxy-6-naphthoate synthase [Ferruginibacter sp.]HQV43258.1 1,4-dihydroxy-6-naphthoate synthase [Ferruginibacter sp.]HQW61554.1 1,4-dihydroxy-6-naphthoate synthase [Ferruginibacter sp.]HQY18855.1 1,4-dihydroxy-6-naphthoate synthase [Ferruginibacter sp.]
MREKIILKIGFSPCPNDTFIFDALVNKKMDTGNLHFEPVLEDVQTLNNWALLGKLPVTKLSYGVLPLVASKYKLLNSGSALGSGVGPLLIALNNISVNDVANHRIAIPGKNTTAHLLFSLAFPEAKHKEFMRYDEIENFVLQGNGLGVIIHENRFTYVAKGLTKIIDLGDYWEKTIGTAIPLGGIVIDKKLPAEIQKQTEALIQKSIALSFAAYPQLSGYVTINAQEMSEAVMRKHIELYVNHFTSYLGEEGKKAVVKLMQVFAETTGTAVNTGDLFV